MTILLTGVKLLAFCIAMGGSGALLFRKKYGEILPLTFATAALIQVPLGIVTGSLTAGYVVCALWVIAFVPLCIYFLAIRRDWGRVMDNLLTPGLFAICIICVLVTIMDVNAVYAEWDEYSHWGPMVRVMFEENWLYSQSSLPFAHHDYPPAAQLFETLVCRFLGELKDEHVYRALQIFTLSMLLPFFEIPYKTCYKTTKQRILSQGFHAACLLMFLLMAFMAVKQHLSLFSSIYLDLLLAVEGGMLLFQSWSYAGSLYSALTIGILSALVLMTKQLGMVFALLAFLILVIRTVIHRNNSTKLETHRVQNPENLMAQTGKNGISLCRHGVLLRSLIAVSFPVAFTILWKAYIASLHLGGQFEVPELAKNAAGVLTCRGFNAFQTRVIGAFTDSIVHRPLNLQSTSTYACQFLFFLIFAVLFSLFLRKYDRQKLPDVLTVLIVLIFGFVLHACALLGLYLFGGFSEFEALHTASFERYMGAYTFAGFVALAGIVFACLNDQYLPVQGIREIVPFAAPLAILCGIFYVLFLGTCIGRYDFGELNSIRPTRWGGEIRSIYQQSQKFLELSGNEGNVLILSQNDNGQKGLEFSYFVSPYPASWINLGVPDEEDFWRKDLSEEQFCEQMKGYQYFYVYHTDETFDRNYAAAVGIDEEPEDGDLYRVDAESGRAEWVTNIPK